MDPFLCCEPVGAVWMAFLAVGVVGGAAVWWRRWMAWPAAAAWWLAASSLYAELAPFIASAPAWFGVHAGAAAAVGVVLPAAAFLLSPGDGGAVRMRIRRRAVMPRLETGESPSS